MLNSLGLKLATQPFRFNGAAVLTALLVALVLLLDALVVSPELHEFFHNDAGAPEHQCAVNLFAQGHVDSASMEVSAVVPVIWVETTPQISNSVFFPAIANLPAGRGPPVSLPCS